MAEKKTTKAAAPKATKKATKAAPKATKTTVLALNAVNAGYKAGAVYQALAAEDKALSVEEIAKKAGIEKEEALLGIGWLFKEGKIKDEGEKVALA